MDLHVSCRVHFKDSKSALSFHFLPGFPGTSVPALSLPVSQHFAGVHLVPQPLSHFQDSPTEFLASALVYHSPQLDHNLRLAGPGAFVVGFPPSLSYLLIKPLGLGFSPCAPNQVIPVSQWNCRFSQPIPPWNHCCAYQAAHHRLPLFLPVVQQIFLNKHFSIRCLPLVGF